MYTKLIGLLEHLWIGRYIVHPFIRLPSKLDRETLDDNLRSYVKMPRIVYK